MAEKGIVRIAEMAWMVVLMVMAIKAVKSLIYSIWYRVQIALITIMDVMDVMAMKSVIMAANVIMSVMVIMCVLAVVAVTSMIYFICHNDYNCLLPHSAPSWILSWAVNLASFSLQDGATEWYYNHWLGQPASQPPGRQSTLTLQSYHFVC